LLGSGGRDLNGYGNNIVKVIDAVRRSRLDELREHGHDTLKQVDAALVRLAFDQLIELHDIEVGRYRRRLRPRLRALITATASFPLTSAATTTGTTTATATATEGPAAAHHRF
jgi:hypothetical protein